MTEADPRRDSTAPPSAEAATEALQRAALHGRRACAEALEAVRALLDAASLGLTGQTADQHAAFAVFSQFLSDLSGRLAVKDTDIAPLILDALGEEIRRWEERSKDDPEARSVLRAFLGLREILWELGVRGTDAETASEDPAPSHEPRMRPVENPE